MIGNGPLKARLSPAPNSASADEADEWMVIYNEQRTHQGRWCFGKTPMETFLDTAAWAREKQTLVKAA